VIEFQGVMFPDGEKHLPEWMANNGEIVDGRGTYQIKKLRAALSHCRSFRTAVDVGGHVGLWSMQLIKRFDYVHAFEPVAAHRECFLHNLGIENDGKFELHACALGEHSGFVEIESAPTSSGDSRVNIAAVDAAIPLQTLDSFGLENVDFIKLDCEGYEQFALRGGEQTIMRDRPTIIVEQKPGRAQRFGLQETGAVTYLEGHGYRCAQVLSGDYIMVPR
jgi:FkbM family methyltransferase